MASIRLGGRRIRLPGNKPLRIGMGGTLVTLGCFGFLPILGFWMVPLGLVILSVDFHPVRRFRRKTEVWWGRRQRAKQGRIKP